MYTNVFMYVSMNVWGCMGAAVWGPYGYIWGCLGLDTCVYVFAWTCIGHMYMHIYINIIIYIYIYICAYMCVCMHVCMGPYGAVWLLMGLYGYKWGRMYVYVYV